MSLAMDLAHGSSLAAVEGLLLSLSGGRASSDLHRSRGHALRLDEGTALHRGGQGMSPHTDRAVRVGDSRSWEDVVEVEFHDDGGLRVFMGRLSDNPGMGEQDIIFDTAVVVYAHRLLGLVRAIADCVGYLGNWSLAVGATGLKGKAAYHRARWLSSSPYEADVYRQATVVSRAELLHSPGAAVDRLAGRLFRGLGVRESWQKELSAPALPEDADLG